MSIATPVMLFVFEMQSSPLNDVLEEPVSFKSLFFFNTIVLYFIVVVFYFIFFVVFTSCSLFLFIWLFLFPIPYILTPHFSLSFFSVLFSISSLSFIFVHYSILCRLTLSWPSLMRVRSRWTLMITITIMCFSLDYVVIIQQL